MPLTSADLQTALAPYLHAVETEMQRVVADRETLLRPFYGMLRYHLGWADENFEPTATRTGKRLRPTFLLLTCAALGGEWQRAVPAAAAIELTHNFSLIHDDIEDRDTERHGRLTLWKRWGDAQAINAGDGLFVLARLALAGLLERGVAAESLAAVQTAYDRACLSITEGQFLDMQFETRVGVTEADYLRMVSGKTAALLAASTQIGALVAGADAATVEGLAQFGHELGVAFQIVDDILGIWGEPTRTGKRAANDIRRRKKSLPVALAFDRASGPSGSRLRAIYAQPTLSEDDVAKVLAILEAVDARDQSQRLADDLHRQARARLTGLVGPSADLLRELTESLARREF